MNSVTDTYIRENLLSALGSMDEFVNNATFFSYLIRKTESSFDIELFPLSIQ